MNDFIVELIEPSPIEIDLSVPSSIEIEFPPIGTKGEQGIGVPVGGSTGDVLAKISDEDFATGWVQATTTVGPSIELDLSGALISVFAEPIVDAVATLYYNLVGNRVVGTLGIVCTPDTVWPEPPEGFPFTTIAIKGSELPYMPRVLALEGLGELPQTMGFGLANIADNMGDFGDPEKNERYGLGGATSIVGGLLEGDPGIIFFKTETGKGSLGNLLLNDYEGISFVGRVMVIYSEINYEIAFPTDQ